MLISEDYGVCGKRYLALFVTVLLVFAVFIGLAGRSSADTGGSDSYGYSWTDSNAPGDQVVFNWVDITGAGSDTGLWGDDSCSFVNIGFSFGFYGYTYGSAYVTSNGMLSFEGYTYDYSNDPIPYSSSPDLLVAPFWDDLAVGSTYNSGLVYYDTIGTSPNQQFIVEYYEITRMGDSSEMTFEIILNETGEIWFQYLTLNGEDGSAASVGIEDYYGYVGSQYSYNSASLSDGLAIRFELGPIGFGSPQSDVGYPGDTLDYELTITNNRFGDDLFDFTFISTYGWTAVVCDDYFVPLGDSDGDTLPDTGVLASGASMYIYVRVTIPGSPTERVENTTIVAISDLNTEDTVPVTLVSETVSAMFAPPHSDYGDDSEPDGLYDFLVIDASVDVLFEGTYNLFVYLYDSSWSYVAGSGTTSYLTAGSWTISFYIDGPTLFAFGTDGAYNADLYLYDLGGYLVYDYYVTGSYLCSEFEPPVAYFDPPNSDSGYDAGTDGLYDLLLVDLGVTSSVEGTYMIDATLYDVAMDYVAAVAYYVYLTAGWQTVELQFDGELLYSRGVSGEYYVTAYLSEDVWTTLDTTEYTTAYYAYDEFQPPGASFAPPHSEHTVDMNSDGYYEYLVVEVQVDVIEASTYQVYGEMYDDWGGWITSWYNITYLDIGLQMVELWFSGYDIYYSYEYGPYEVDLTLYDDTSSPIGYDIYYTADYYYGDFDTDMAWFMSSHSDAGRDENGNTFYDWLVVYVSVCVLVEGDYELDAELYDPYGGYVTDASNSTYLYTGVQTVEIWFYGQYVYNTGDSGSFEVSMDLYYDYWDFQDSDVYYTSDYSYDEFEPPGAYFSPPHSDWGEDADSDVLFDYLVVEVSLGATVEGDYYVEGGLYDSEDNYLGWTDVYCYLVVGSNVADLYFSGGLLYGTHLDGAYTVDLYLYDGYWNYLGYDMYTTQVYGYEEFEPPAACFWPPHSDAGVDSDGDSLYEWLAVTVHIDVQIAGDYEVYGYLYSTWWDYLASAVNLTYLDAGVDSIVLLFPGWMLNALGYDSAYEVELYLYSDSYGDLDYDYYETGVYSFSDFDDEVPAIESQWASVAPVIDGVIDDGEWDAATVVDLAAADPENEIEAYMLVMNNATQLFIAYDVVGDTWNDNYDFASVGFDNGNDGALVDGGEDQFMMESYTDATYHYVYDSYWDEWVYECGPFDPDATDHEGLTGDYGFGPSPMDASDHRMFELSIPLALLGVSAGDTLGFVAASYYGPGIFDDYWYDESYWPLYDTDVYEQSMYGDLVLADAVPETTASLDGTVGGGGWYVSDVTVTLEATGGDGGVDYTNYSVDGGSWTTYTAPFDVSGEGVTTVEFFSVDMAGNEEDIKSVDVMIDTVAPSTSYSLDGYTVTLAGSDASSGVETTHYRIDDGAWTTYSGSFTVTGSGSHTVEFYSVDVAGNEEAVDSFSISAEEDPPTTEASIAGTEGLLDWYVSDVEVTLTADDGDGSGIDATMYSIDDGSWRTYSAPFDISDDGTHTIEFYSVDNAGNEEEAQTAEIKVDATAPTATASVVASEVTLSAVDGTSGVSMILYRIDDGDWQVYDGAFVVEGSGNHTVEYYAADNAGNEGIVQSVVVEGSGGGISAVLIGALIGAAVLAAVGLLIFLVLRKKKGQQQAPPPPEMMQPPPPAQ